MQRGQSEDHWNTVWFQQFTFADARPIGDLVAVSRRGPQIYSKGMSVAESHRIQREQRQTSTRNFVII
jgi:hypothetical protein